MTCIGDKWANSIKCYRRTSPYTMTWDSPPNGNKS